MGKDGSGGFLSHIGNLEAELEKKKKKSMSFKEFKKLIEGKDPKETISTAAQVVIHSIENFPENWYRDGKRYFHKETGLVFEYKDFRTFDTVQVAPDSAIQHIFTLEDRKAIRSSLAKLGEHVKESQRIQKEFVINWKEKSTEPIQLVIKQEEKQQVDSLFNNLRGAKG